MSDVLTLLNLACIKHTGQALPRNSQELPNWKFHLDDGKKRAVWSPSPYFNSLQVHTSDDDPDRNIIRRVVVDELKFIFGSQGARLVNPMVVLDLGKWALTGLALRKLMDAELAGKTPNEIPPWVMVYLLTNPPDGLGGANAFTLDLVRDWWEERVEEVKSYGITKPRFIFETIYRESGIPEGELSASVPARSLAHVCRQSPPSDEETTELWTAFGFAEETLGKIVLNPRCVTRTTQRRYGSIHAYSTALATQGKERNELFLSTDLTQYNRLERALGVGFPMIKWANKHRKSLCIYEKFFDFDRLTPRGSEESAAHRLRHGIPRAHLDAFLAHQKIRKDIYDHRSDFPGIGTHTIIRQANTTAGKIPKTKRGIQAHYDFHRLLMFNSLTTGNGLCVPDNGHQGLLPYFSHASGDFWNRKQRWRHAHTWNHKGKRFKDVVDTQDDVLEPEELVRIFCPNKNLENLQLQEKIKSNFPR